MGAIIGALLGFFGSLLPLGSAQAHALEPGYLEMRVVGPDQYAVLWKVPAVGGRPMPIAARLPATCDRREPGELRWDGDAYYSRWTASCHGRLGGEALRIEGLEQTSTDVLARIEAEEGEAETLRLTPSEPEVVLVGRRSLGQIAYTYFRLGVEHILGGIDHLLFVAALLLLVSGWRRLVGTVTSFTIAHSITLAASTLGVITVPVAPIEALIALSIAFVAAEVLHRRQGRHSLTNERPWLIAFAFGLLHGVGFASALAEIGLPPNSIPLALLFFNVGVEIGQLLFIATVFGIIWTARWIVDNLKLSHPTWVWAIPPYAIGSLAFFWLMQRLSAF